jgi:hypothetical protein
MRGGISRRGGSHNENRHSPIPPPLAGELSGRGRYAAIPAAATALSGLPAAIPPHLDGRKIEGLAEMLAMLEDMPPDEANKILDFLARAIGQARHDLAADADLMALKPAFDQMFDNWWARWEDSMEHSRAVDAAVLERHPELSWDEGRRLVSLDPDSPELKAWMTARRALEASIGRRYPERSDEETEEDSDKELVLTDKILSHRPVTREGLALQCRAFIMHGYDDPHRTRAFVSGVANFLFLDLPEGLAEKRLTLCGENKDEEDEYA